LKTIWYIICKNYVRGSLFFFSKKIKIQGLHNIPKKGAILFLINHPNGLIDPLLIAANINRKSHFLVNAKVFKSSFVAKLLDTLNLIPIYRMRDGFSKLNKNEMIFEKCFSILNRKETLMIFPEGSHDKRRTIRPVSKGFTRILFGAIEREPNIPIQMIPVGVTYQHSNNFPIEAAVCIGNPINANQFYDDKNPKKSIDELKEVVENELKKLSVHIPANECYHDKLVELNKANVDFTKVEDVNKMIVSNKVLSKPKKNNYSKFLRPLLVVNNLLPFLIWAIVKKQVEEIEFKDTFRFAVFNVIGLINLILQTLLISLLWNGKTGLLYCITSLTLILLYSKLFVTHPRLHSE